MRSWVRFLTETFYFQNQRQNRCTYFEIKRYLGNSCLVMYGNGRDDNDYGRYPRVGISEDRCVYGRRDDCDAVALKFRGRRDDRYRERYDRFLRTCVRLFACVRPAFCGRASGSCGRAPGFLYNYEKQGVIPLSPQTSYLRETTAVRILSSIRVPQLPEPQLPIQTTFS